MEHRFVDRFCFGSVMCAFRVGKRSSNKEINMRKWRRGWFNLKFDWAPVIKTTRAKTFDVCLLILPTIDRIFHCIFHHLFKLFIESVCHTRNSINWTFSSRKRHVHISFTLRCAIAIQQTEGCTSRRTMAICVLFNRCSTVSLVWHKRVHTCTWKKQCQHTHTYPD